MEARCHTKSKQEQYRDNDGFIYLDASTALHTVYYTAMVFRMHILSTWNGCADAAFMYIRMERQFPFA